jgi:hypothetical protein
VDCILRQLRDDGFAVIPGPAPLEKLPELANLYDQAVLEADPADIAIGSTTTRVSDFVNRSAEFDCLYLHPPLLQACRQVIGRPYKLSTLHARTLRPRMPAQKLHVDFAADSEGWPMVGFIFMIDEFRPDNGATCFVPGSQGASTPPVRDLVSACGPAGSMIVFNGSVWHGHGANRTDEPRRSIQGAYIRRSESSGGKLPERMRPETLARLGPLARYLLAVR